MSGHSLPATLPHPLAKITLPVRRQRLHLHRATQGRQIFRCPPSQNVKSRNFRDWNRIWITRNNFNLISGGNFSFFRDRKIETASPTPKKFLYHVVRSKSDTQFVARQP